MAINLMIGLEGGEGLGAVVVLSGLSHRMLVLPAVYGVPVLTALPDRSTGGSRRNRHQRFMAAAAAAEPSAAAL